MAKAGRPKKGSARLPAWFDIQKYAPAKNFSALDWYQQASFRKTLFEITKSEGIVPMRAGKRYLPKFVDLIVSNPIMTNEGAKDCITMRRGGHTLRDVMAEIILDTIFEPDLHVRELTNYEALSWYGVAERNLKKFATDSDIPMPTITPHGISAPNNLSEQAMSSIEKFLMDTFDNTEKAILSVNMSAPDAILIGEFEDFLHRQRKTLGGPGNPIDKSRDFDDWFKCGILPYLDLKLWETVKGESFHWTSFGEALTGITKMRYGSESAHIKAVKACEQLLMDDRTLRLLQSQALREEAGHLKKSRKMSIRNSEN